MDATVQKLRHAGRFSVSPVYSLFSVSRCGNYDLILKSSDPVEIVREFEQAAARALTIGLEIRCDGMRVEL